MTVKLIDQHVSSTHAKNAIETILRYSRKKRTDAEDTELLGYAEERIALQITTKRLKADKTVRPHVIPLAHPLVDPRKEQICLITKDPQREYKDLLEAKNVKFISRVVGVTKLKGKFRGYEERRQLLKEHGLFLVDERVAEMMPKLLGSMWFKAKKQPTPVNLTRADLKGHLERAISNTFMNQNAGGTISVKVATTAQTHSQVYENICKGLPEIIKHISEEWDNVQSIYLTIPGVSLPIWTCELGAGEGARWDWMEAEKKAAEDDAGEWGGADGSDDDEDVVVYKKEDKKTVKKMKAVNDIPIVEESDPKPSGSAQKKKTARSSDTTPSKTQNPQLNTAPIPAAADTSPPNKSDKVKKSQKNTSTPRDLTSVLAGSPSVPSSSKQAKPKTTTTSETDATLLSDTAIPPKPKKCKAAAITDDALAVPLDLIALKEAAAPSKKRKSLTGPEDVDDNAKRASRDVKGAEKGSISKKRKSDVEGEPTKKTKSSKTAKGERRTKGQ
ncbi:hypothetical protein FRB95_007297 [Tulasnella sp. JGI-2019a]|nr:hypothetical protein FRB95_007297 [Tulasnella sp. JGI-2019a]